MGIIYSGSNTTAPIGKVTDYNNTNPSKAVALYRLHSPNPLTVNASGYNTQSTGFAQAIYGDGSYSLLHPNSTTDYVANNIDVLA